MKALALSLALAWGMQATAENGGAHPCKEKRDNRHASRKALETCLRAWWHVNPKLNNPSDDCTGKLGTFIEAAKTYKVCHAEKGK